MIVKTSNNVSIYTHLFEQASQALAQVPGIDENDRIIGNIDEYFAVIQDLAPLDPIFTILPADEEFFHIDANTRQIKIPKSFANGASVVGDESAEIIYFDIDRYFDIQDLASTKIFVQCHTPDDKNYLCDVINVTTKFPDSDKLVFGWPLTNELTAVPGNLQFAVRFYNRKGDIDSNLAGNQNQLVYSFSTLTHIIKINQTLNFNLPVIDEQGHESLPSEEASSHLARINKNDMIFNRIRNSLLPGTIQVAAPVFALLKVVNNKPQVTTDNNADFIVPITDNNKTILYAKADYDSATIQASIANGKRVPGTSITYTWNRQQADSIDSDEANAIYVQDYYFETTDNSYNSNDIYYKKNNDNTYEVYTGQTMPQDITLYEKFTGFDITGLPAASYTVTAHSRAGRVESLIAEEQSVNYEVPGPKYPMVTIKTNNKSLKNGLLEFSVVSPISFYGDGIGEENNLTWQWKKSDQTIISGATGNTYFPTGLLPTETEEYFVECTNTVNQVSVSTPSNILLATWPASDIISVELDKISNEFDVNKGSSGIKAIVTLAHPEFSTELHYTWYKKGTNEDVAIHSGVLYNKNNTPYEFELTVQPPVGANYTISGGSSYYCTVENIYNQYDATNNPNGFDTALDYSRTSTFEDCICEGNSNVHVITATNNS